MIFLSKMGILETHIVWLYRNVKYCPIPEPVITVGQANHFP